MLLLSSSEWHLLDLRTTEDLDQAGIWVAVYWKGEEVCEWNLCTLLR